MTILPPWSSNPQQASTSSLPRPTQQYSQPPPKQNHSYPRPSPAPHQPYSRQYSQPPPQQSQNDRPRYFTPPLIRAAASTPIQPFPSHPERRFSTDVFLRSGPSNPGYPDCLITYNQQTRYFNLIGFDNEKTRVRYTDTLVVYTGGDCGEILGERVAAAGVHFGMGNANNISKVVRREGPVVLDGLSKDAEVDRSIRMVNKEVGAFAAAEMAMNILHDLQAMSRKEAKLIVIITDSEYVTSAMTDFIWDWERNGWKDSSGQPVHIKEEVEMLHSQVTHFERSGVIVKFWTLDMKGNENALRLAREEIFCMRVKQIEKVKKMNGTERKALMEKIERIKAERQKLENEEKDLEEERELLESKNEMEIEGETEDVV